MQEKFIQDLYNHNSTCFREFPEKRAAGTFIDSLFDFLFLPNNISEKTEAGMLAEFEELKHRLSSVLQPVLNDVEKARQIVDNFFSTVPNIYQQLLQDANSILNFDPAAEALEEILVAYPGFYATAIYRFSHQLYEYKIPILPRLFSEYAHSKTGIDIHPGAKIGHPFFIDHGTGIVIGETSIIGNNVKIYQGVTLGALNVAKELSQVKRHPTIEDNVIIYANATILGGETIVGRSSIIGGNVWLTESVPSNSVVYHKSEISVKDNLLPGDMEINFVI
ncbi:MAG: serine O-acetyltransferase EpsC [Niabella sp.]